MKRLLVLAALLLAGPAMAETVGGSGTQPYSCTVVGNPSISLVSTGQNSLTATGGGSITQNADTTYTLTAVTATGPDVNRQSTISVASNSLNTSATESAGTTSLVSGEVSEATTYTITISSSDGVLTAGDYTASADLTCAATP